MKILLILSTVKPEWRPLSSNCRPLPVKVLNGSSCHTGRNKKREASTQYFLNIRLRAFYTLSVGSLFTCYHAQKVLFVLEFMFAFTKLRLQIPLPFEHGNVDTNYPRMHVVIFVCVCMCVSYFSLSLHRARQCQTEVSTNNQHFQSLVHVCAWKCVSERNLSIWSRCQSMFACW